MEAIKHKMCHPLDTLKGMIRGIIEHCNIFDKKRLVVFADGSLNSAIAAHCAYEASVNGALGKLIFVRSIDTTQHAQDITTAYPDVEVEVVDLGMIGILAQPRAAQVLSNAIAQINQGVVIHTGDLTEYYVGPVKPLGDEYPLLKFFIKSELEKLAKTIIDWNNSNMDKALADPRNTSIDNPLAAQENPMSMDTALCVVLAAKDSQCDILLGGYKDHAISEAFKKTKLIRSMEKLDYNTIRAQLMRDDF